MKKLLMLMIVCAMFTGCSDKTASSSETDTPASSSATEHEDDAMAVDTQENAVLGAFMCGDHLIGGDEWNGFDNGYKPETSLKDGEFLSINADITFLHGSESGYTNAPQIDRLISETPVDYDTAIEQFGIPLLGEKAGLHSGMQYYRNLSGTYITAVSDNIRIYLNGQFVCETDWNNSETLMRLCSDPELLEAVCNGKEIPRGGSYVAEFYNNGNYCDVNADTIKDIIHDGIGNIENFNEQPTEEYTAEFDKKCKTEGFLAKLYYTENVDLELFGTTYDADYIIVAADSPDGQPYFSINGNEMKPFPKEYADELINSAQQ